VTLMSRLLLLTLDYHPEPIGIARCNTELCQWLAARGWQVEVITGIPIYPWWRVPADYAHRDYRNGRSDEVIAGVHVHRVPHWLPSPTPSGLARLRHQASWLFACWRRLRRLDPRPDVVLGIAPPFAIGLLLASLRRRIRAPVVYHVQDLQIDAAIGLGMLPGPLGPVMRFVERRILRDMDQVTACGAGMLPRLEARARLRRPALLWPNWADVQRMRPWTSEDGPNPERPALGAASDETVVLYSGSLGRKQGLEGLIAAARGLPSGLHVTICGQGSELTRLQALAGGLSTITWLELRPEDRLRALLCAADIHVIPQVRDAADLVLPSKLINILAVGKPVVVTADPDSTLARMVRASGAGCIVPPDDHTALSKTLAVLASDRERLRRMGEAGRVWCEQQLGQEAILTRIERQLASMVKHVAIVPSRP